MKRPERIRRLTKPLPMTCNFSRCSGRKINAASATAGRPAATAAPSDTGRNAIAVAAMQNIAPKRLSDKTIIVAAAANVPQNMRWVARERTSAHMKMTIPKLPAEIGSRKTDDTR